MVKRILDLPLRILGGRDLTFITSLDDILTNCTTQNYLPWKSQSAISSTCLLTSGTRNPFCNWSCRSKVVLKHTKLQVDDFWKLHRVHEEAPNWPDFDLPSSQTVWGVQPYNFLRLTMLFSKHYFAGNSLFYSLSGSPEISFFLASAAVQLSEFFSDCHMDQLQHLSWSRAACIASFALSW